jgi:hypothetical protein
VSIVDDIQAEAEARIREMMSYYYTNRASLDMHKRPDGVWEFVPPPIDLTTGTITIYGRGTFRGDTIRVKLPKRYRTEPAK